MTKKQREQIKLIAKWFDAGRQFGMLQLSLEDLEQKLYSGKIDENTVSDRLFLANLTIKYGEYVAEFNDRMDKVANKRISRVKKAK